ncbi:zinc ribbon-containing protein [Sporohalobacter salinus]|nr:hypothetical protein [Sporohalobacter salinus]MBM7622542.1 DNA-directed RNA polymerase subunit RPC12/RpoP [Sporohalobacter salinus]
MPSTGDRPGKGSYQCKNCGETLKLDNIVDKLPPCPNCNATNYNKLW